MAEEDEKLDDALAGLDQDKRNTLTRLVKSGAFAAPIVAAFAMQGISIRPAHAPPVGSSSNATAPSDIRLKKDVTRIGAHASGCGLYRFRYLWSDLEYVGAIAQDVLEHVPEAVIAGPGNFLIVDYGKLGMAMTHADGGAA
jgi:hypothetical protein